MQELMAISVLLLALVVLIVGFHIKVSPAPLLSPPPIPAPQPIEPQVVPIYFPRPIYPFPRLGYPIRRSPPPMRLPIRH